MRMLPTRRADELLPEPNHFSVLIVSRFKVLGKRITKR
ncbi:hypothetical protein SPHINGO8AM_50052 [Sphingomonas sp. 8AM]|nr:hypothetical protein SPHINGO8AM_50052 [Sphingomonas sp. 8AM]